MGDRTAAVFDKEDLSSPVHYPASQTAVLLLDFHSLFVQRAGGARASVAAQQAIKLRQWAKQAGIPVIHALIDVNEPPPSTCKGVPRLMSIVNMLRDSPELWEEPEGLKGEADGELMLLRAPGYVSALTSKNFHESIAGHGIKSLVLGGLSTSGCVMRTAFAATDAEYVVTIIQDACADPADGLHETLIETVLPGRAHCCTLDQFIAEWQKAAPK